MAQPLTIQISDTIFQSLQLRAKQLGKTPEVVAAECIAQSIGSEADDPLLKWAGAIDSQPSDVAERHDDYLGQSVANDLRPGPNRRDPEAWSKALREWAASHAKRAIEIDDSRESIYAGRGE
jgi:hypothetical protein